MNASFLSGVEDALGCAGCTIITIGFGIGVVFMLVLAHYVH